MKVFELVMILFRMFLIFVMGSVPILYCYLITVVPKWLVCKAPDPLINGHSLPLAVLCLFIAIAIGVLLGHLAPPEKSDNDHPTS